MGYLDNTGLQRFFTGLKSVFAPLSHSHAASDITSGTISETRLPIASSIACGIVSAGSRVSIDQYGAISADDMSYTHPSYTARTGKPTADLTPEFGDAITVSQIESDNTGHVTGATDRTITIPDTVMSGADASTAGSIGLVPAPSAGDENRFLAGDGTWKTPTDTNTTYTFASSSTDGAFDVTPSDTGTAQTVAITGLGSAAYTASTDYATSGHGHSNASSSAAGFMSTTDKSKLDAVGTYYSNSGSSSVTSGSNATLCSIQNLPAGVYVVEATCRFANNTTGRRGLRIDTSSSASAESATQHTTVVSAASGYTIVNTAAVMSFSAQSTVYARIYQNSGSSLSTSGYMYAVRIK